jgi:hypothetical protein
MSVFCERSMLSGRGLCDGPITSSEDFYRVWCVEMNVIEEPHGGGIGPQRV